jgi:small-conductance mechanosensitive channel
MSWLLPPTLAFKQALRIGVIALLMLGLTLCQASQALSDPGSPISIFFPRLNNSGEIGNLVYDSVRLDGRNLFEVAATRTSTGDQDAKGTGALDVRIDRVENRLRQVRNQTVAKGQALEDDQIVVNELNAQMVVQAMLDKTSTPLSIVTVTSSDVEIYGLPTPTLADYYASQIRAGLIRAYQERQPEYIRTQIWRTAILVMIAALLSGLLLFLNRRNRRRQQHLRSQINSVKEAIAALDPHASAEESAQRDDLRQEHYQLNRQLSNWSIRLRIIQMATIVIWLIAVSFSMRLFPQTRILGVLLIRQPVWLMVLWFAIILALQVSHQATDRLLKLWANEGFIMGSTAYGLERRKKRLPTLSRTLKDIENGVWLVIGLILAFRILTWFSDFRLVASAGVLGLAASIGLQSALKDAVRGAMVLWQDAYTVGDVIATGDVSGYVETLNLLATQLRSSAGELITISNGEITTVKNMTKDWSRMDLTIEVAYETDVDKALHIMGQTLATMALEAEWQDKILEAPDVLAIENLAASGATLKIRTKTAPMQQWNVSREFRHRLKQQFEAAGIALGRPQQAIMVQTTKADHSPQNSPGDQA